MNKEFRILIGPSKLGWCDYAISIDDKSWVIQASYIGKHPLFDHIHTAVDLYDCIANDFLPENEIMPWECLALDEFGHILLKVKIHKGALKINLHYSELDIAIGPAEMIDSLVVEDMSLNLMTYIESVVYATAHAINLQGVMGLTEGFATTSAWELDGHAEIIPYHLFLYLASIVKYGKPRTKLR